MARGGEDRQTDSHTERRKAGEGSHPGICAEEGRGGL